MKAVKTLISILFSLLVFFILFYFRIYAVIFSKSYLNRKYKEYDVAADLSMTEEDLEAVTGKLVDYVKGREDSIEIEVSVRGEISPFYNDTDISHMKDVRGIIIRLRDFLVLSSFAKLFTVTYINQNSALQILSSFFECFSDDFVYNKKNVFFMNDFLSP